MPIIKIPHLVDVVSAFEKASLEMGKETGAMVSSAPGRFRNASGRKIDFSFMRLGDRKWKLGVSIEQVCSHTSSSAFRIHCRMPEANPEDEVVNVMNDEQLSDLALRYAEKICNAAAGNEASASETPATMPTYTPPKAAAVPEEDPSGNMSAEALLASITASNAAAEPSADGNASIADILAAAQASAA